MLRCPRDQSELATHDEHGIAADACPACGGAWYDFQELALLEATVARDDDRVGTVEYAKRTGALRCPVCGASMTAFDYRGNNLELDACPAEHGFWLDGGEPERVRALMRERVRGLRRSSSAERSWRRAREAGFQDRLIDRVLDLFRRR